MLRIYELIEKVAPAKATVLLDGRERDGQGTGRQGDPCSSPRRDRAFVAVNCAALPEKLLESELFGHERGAFTGATSARAGSSWRTAGRSCSTRSARWPPLQAKLLRVLQERSSSASAGSRRSGSTSA